MTDLKNDIRLGHKHAFVDKSTVVIGRNLLDGHYACPEKNGTIVVRNLKRESEQWCANRDSWAAYDFSNYPYNKNWNFLYMEMYWWGESKPFGCDYEKRGCYLKPDDVVVDIGASIGVFTRRALEKGAKRVYAFEPSVDAYKCLLLNVDHSKVDTQRSAVYSHSGYQTMMMTKEAYPMLGIDGGTNREVIERVLVPCYTLDDLIGLGVLPTKIDFMKVDVEGAELELFDALSDTNLANIDRLAIEMHRHLSSEKSKERTLRFESLYKRLKSNFDYNKITLYNRGSKGGWTETVCLWRNS